MDQVGVPMKCAVLYLLVSTGRVDLIRRANQERELREVAHRAGWAVADFQKITASATAKGKDKRPAFNASKRAAATGREFDVLRDGGGRADRLRLQN